MRIAILAAGAAGMYCGSCLRDSALATALLRRGEEVTLIPLYTPLRTDEPSSARGEVFYGGVNAWLQYALRIFRRTPRVIDWIFDRPWLLNVAGKMGAQTSPAKLGPFINSILRGDAGPQIKELRRLIGFLKGEVRPQVVSIPNLMFIGTARMLKVELGAPIVCELSGEDIFLDAMAEPWRMEARDLICAQAEHVDRFVAMSRYYARRMAEYLRIAVDRIEVVYPGISKEHFELGSEADEPSPQPSPRVLGEGATRLRPATVGYFARVCPEKGLDRLLDGQRVLRTMPEMEGVRVRAAGYLGGKDRKWFEEVRKSAKRDGLDFEYIGEVDLKGKLEFLRSIDVLSVPTAYQEAKGIYVLEALAQGVAVVEPSHGAFPELIEMTEGGVLVRPDDAKALAEGLAGLLRDSSRREEMGRRGREVAKDLFTDDGMAERMLGIYQRLVAA